MSIPFQWENYCNICFYAYDCGDREAVILPCAHCFCVTCLTTLRSTESHECPMCRKSWKDLQLKHVDVKPIALGACAISDGHDFDLKMNLKKGIEAVCREHNQPFLFWCDDCKEFACRRCVRAKQNTCKFDDIEDNLHNIKSYVKIEIDKTAHVIQNNATGLHAELMKTAETLLSLEKMMEELMKRQHDLTKHDRLLDNMACKERQDMTEVKKYLSIIENIEKESDIPIVLECLKTLQNVTKCSVPEVFSCDCY